MRSFSQAAIDALKAGNPTGNLIKIDLDSPLYMTDLSWDQIYNGHNYLSNGLLSGISKQAIKPGVGAGDWDITISDTDNTAFSAFFGAEIINKWVTHYTAIFDSSYQLIEVITTNRGQIITPEASRSAKAATVKLKISSPAGDTEFVNGRRTNDTSQQRFFPNDNGFKYVHAARKVMPWGYDDGRVKDDNGQTDPINQPGFNLP